MFGHQDNKDDHHHHDDGNQPMDDVLNHDAVNGVLQDNFNPALPASDADQPGQHSDSFVPAADDSYAEPVTVSPSDASSDSDTPADNVVAAAPVSAVGGDLLSIKQQALTQLSPLVGHLDQAPEEKFRTTMMMIQASDNQDLIQTAYDAAQAISDEKVKAQALLDIVNEINYFTQQNS